MRFKSVADYIQSKDKIVKPSSSFLHFEHDWQQKTLLGGLVSMSVSIYLLYIVYTNGRKMIKKDSNQIISIQE